MLVADLDIYIYLDIYHLSIYLSRYLSIYIHIYIYMWTLPLAVHSQHVATKPLWWWGRWAHWIVFMTSLYMYYTLSLVAKILDFISYQPLFHVELGIQQLIACCHIGSRCEDTGYQSLLVLLLLSFEKWKDFLSCKKNYIKYFHTCEKLIWVRF